MHLLTIAHTKLCYRWKKVVGVWELLIYNQFLDLETWWLPLAVLAAGGTLAYRQRHRWMHIWPWRTKHKPSEGGRDLSV